MDYQSFISTYPHLFSNVRASFVIITDPGEIAKWQEAEKKKLINENKPETWSDIGIVLSDPYIIVLRDLVLFQDGQMGGYIRVINRSELDASNAVAVLPIFNNEIILVRHFRHATRSWHLEIPRGYGERGISAVDNAYKEIREELEGEIEELTELGITQPNTGLENNPVRLFFAKLSLFGKPDINEGISKTYHIPVNELESLIIKGLITDGFTLSAYTRARLRNLI